VDCVFCGIATGAVPAHVVYEDDDAMAFLDIHPATIGHTLVIPRRHATDIWSLAPDDAAAVARAALVVADQLRAALDLSGLSLVQANGRAAGQTVFHFHLHLVPRKDGDGLLRPWRPIEPDTALLEDVARRIRRGSSNTDAT
jgi:histidine triad (HIT) family protein